MPALPTKNLLTTALRFCPSPQCLAHQRSAHLALVVFEHECGLNHICQRLHLNVAEHELEQREDPFGRLAAEFGVKEPTICCQRPCRKLLAMIAPEEQDVRGKLADIAMVEGSSSAL